MATIALVIFALVYVVIILGEHSPRRLDRPAAALIGAVLMVICGVMTRGQALASIDFPTLALLFGMMIIVHYATVSGLLEALADKLVHYGHTPTQLLWVVCFTSGILSALFVNDTICLLMTPLLIRLTRRAGLPTVPYLLCLATSSNVGSAMTITGNPQNMLIGQSSHWTWAAFALRMVPIGLICLCINGLICKFVYRRELSEKPEFTEVDTTNAIAIDKKLALKTIIVTCALLIGFLVGAPMDLVALSAGVGMLVLANRPPEETFANIDWSLLLFFAGLFVVVQGVTNTQTAFIGQLIDLSTKHTTSLSGLGIFAAATVVASNIFGNVPFVMLIRGWMTHAENAGQLWLVLAMASTFAGNLTLVGSVANLIVANGARKECPLGFMEFVKTGIPSTFATVLIGVLLLWMYDMVGWR